MESIRIRRQQERFLLMNRGKEGEGRRPQQQQQQQQQHSRRGLLNSTSFSAGRRILLLVAASLLVATTTTKAIQYTAATAANGNLDHHRHVEEEEEGTTATANAATAADVSSGDLHSKEEERYSSSPGKNTDGNEEESVVQEEINSNNPHREAVLEGDTSAEAKDATSGDTITTGGNDDTDYNVISRGAETETEAIVAGGGANNENKNEGGVGSSRKKRQHLSLEDLWEAEAAMAHNEAEDRLLGWKWSDDGMSLPTRPPVPTPPVTKPPTPTIPSSPAPSGAPTKTARPTTTKPPATSPPVTAPPTSPDFCLQGRTRDQYLFDELSLITEFQLLLDTSTPQGLAYDYMVNSDPLQPNVCTYPTINQRYGLVTLYYSTGGPTWANNTNWLTATNECEWYGVHCDGEEPYSGNPDFITRARRTRNLQVIVDLPPSTTPPVATPGTGGAGVGSAAPVSAEPASSSNTTGLVFNLTLEENNLVGTIPNEISTLYYLHRMRFYNNTLTGILPQGLANLTELHVLDVEMNGLSGPAFTGQVLALGGLTDLLMSNNLFTGTLPEAINALSGLQSFWAASNQLFGTIPTTMATMANLSTIILYSNGFDAKLEDTPFGSLPLLENLQLYENVFEGTIPDNFFGLTNLQTLRLDKNFIQGTVSPSIGQLSLLTDLRYGTNLIVEPIPETLGQLTDLKYLVIGSNYFSNGTIPDIFSTMTSLETVDISLGGLGGTIPTSIFTGSPNMREIYLNNNELRGTLPPEFATPPDLQDLFLNNNFLTGTVPEIGGLQLQLGKLNEFLLQFNQLTGSMPASVCSLRTNAVLDDLFADCQGDPPEIECDFPTCCNQCFQNDNDLSLINNSLQLGPGPGPNRHLQDEHNRAALEEFVNSIRTNVTENALLQQLSAVQWHPEQRRKLERLLYLQKRKEEVQRQRRSKQWDEMIPSGAANAQQGQQQEPQDQER